MSATAEPQGGLFTISGRQWLILLMVQLANLLFGMTITLANLVLPEVRGAVSATQDEISWVITLNLAATAVATPMTGWLAGRLGWRSLMFGTVLGFTLASLACGLATSLDQLILARVAQGAFGAPIMPLGQAVLLGTFPKHLHSTALVVWGVGAVFGPVLGPILGAMATEAWNWRAAFFMIVPPGICTLVCIWFALRDHTSQSSTRFDWTGFLALSVALIAAQLVLDRGQRMDWFDSPTIIACCVMGALALWIFVAHCLTTEHPFLNPRLLLDRNFSVGLLISLVMGMLAFTSLSLFPTLLHDLRGYPHNAIGLLIAARGMGNWLAFLVVIQFTSVAPRLAIATGLALQAASAFWMAQFDINLTESDIFWSHLLQGFGQSIAFTPMAVMAFSTLPSHQVTEGSAVFTLMRNFGSSLFVSLSVLVLIRTTAMSYSEMTSLVSPYNEALALPGLPSQWDIGSTSGLLRLSNEILRQASMIGYINAFHLMAFTAAAAVPLAGLMGARPKAP
ncbi:DHA2 family efflux MFS transporter permease subunit [Roseicella aerolata]|uniref:DHA2 family efflux MFS transporter permease subunit n=1 Tax=Roseicella aerolata TaxID=2883479 RepID=A0A9X1LAS2_9PROT|nr:DHA2 family efflux MFS transporter permease subunit [Roseicella aerolata]MCB4822475.1 DHA2 family efflux MFS transporter permease subunit [Roseicella aerolata]